MDKVLDYANLFGQALGKIKSIRDPHATRAETSDLRWNDVASKIIFDFAGNGLRKHYNISQAANEISYSCLCYMIVTLMENYDYSIQKVKIDESDGLAKARLCIFEKKQRALLLFKELEECPFWKMKDKEPENVRNIMRHCGASTCKYIYFVLDNAYLQVIGHNNDSDDPGRGYNVYSIKWFFEEYFGVDEYRRFAVALNNYIHDVQNCIGYISVKTLTPGSLMSFRKITENEIQKYPYNTLINITMNNQSIESGELSKIETQFFDDKTYQGLLGENDYSESFITAEWLYDSMKRSQAIDLTIIGTGYFKAVEQLLYDLICLHKNEGRQIKRDNSRHELPPTIELNDTNIMDNAIDTTIGSMAVFYRDNMDILRDDITWRTRKYIRETVFGYRDLRNSYFHKDNIHDWNRIDTIRNRTFELLFLLLGSHELTEEHKASLGFPTIGSSDYYKLCEYVHYHHGEIFFIDLGRENEELAFGYYDEHSKVINDRYTMYSGVYFKELELGKAGRVFRFLENNLPSRVSLGKMVYGYSEKITISPVKVKTVFENGRFIGPSIAEEERLDY